MEIVCTFASEINRPEAVLYRFVSRISTMVTVSARTALARNSAVITIFEKDDIF